MNIFILHGPDLNLPGRRETNIYGRQVHLSNIYTREQFWRQSVIAPVAAGQTSGLGIPGYFVALRAVALAGLGGETFAGTGK